MKLKKEEMKENSFKNRHYIARWFQTIYVAKNERMKSANKYLINLIPKII